MKKKKLLATIIPIIAAIVAVVIILTLVVVPENKYIEANNLMAEGKYEEAIDIFQELDGYKDSNILIEECENEVKEKKYKNAISKMSEGKYEDAIDIFQELDGYKDCNNLIEECNIALEEKIINDAVELAENGEVKKALGVLYELSIEHNEQAYEKYKEILLARGKGVVSEGDYILYGSYEQDNNTENGTEYIEWEVLYANTKGDITLVSKNALDCQPYHYKQTDLPIVWADSSLRFWLNNDFLCNAFSSEEQEDIQRSYVPADEKSDPAHMDDWFDSFSDGLDVQDKIYLLSKLETEAYFGFNGGACEPTAYAASKDICFGWGTRSVDYGWDVVMINRNGGVQSIDMNSVSYTRPAMQLKLMDDGILDSSDFKEKDAIKQESSVKYGDVLMLGKYEQDGYDENGKEAIEWEVIDVEDSKALLISKYALAYLPYNEGKEAVTWENCTLRKWLNNDFINSAFTDEEKNRISVTNVPADKSPAFDTDPGNNTQDHIFLLSCPEVDAYLGFGVPRFCHSTLYAKTKVGMKESFSSCMWWLRTPGAEQNRAACIDLGGFLCEDGYYVNGAAICAVRPALWIELP